ncbi:hypothetical protein BC827DRAFT_331206 [Russula dissimulans]|nr:hypothetical protein BC827DRAFT_331206 [Russula dissimulans]
MEYARTRFIEKRRKRREKMWPGEDLWGTQSRRRSAPVETFERATPPPQADTTTTATHRTRAGEASCRPEPDLPESPRDASPTSSVGAERCIARGQLLHQVERRSDITSGLNETVDNPFTTHHQSLNENSTPPSPTQEYVLAPPPVPFHSLSMTLPNEGYNPTPSDAGTDAGDVQRRIVQGQLPPQVKRRLDTTDELDEAEDTPSRPEDTDLPVQSPSDASNDAPRGDSTSPTPTQGHIPSSSSVPLRIKKPPNKHHPTLSSWIINMDKLSSLIDRLQELASSAPETHRSQLSRQVVELRETFKRQKERYIEFLQLSEEYASKYLRDISSEIQQQRSFLEALEKRLAMAKMLHGQAVTLRKSYESGTVATMKDVRVTALPQPLPEDFDLFSEVDSVLAEIRRCYEELDKFWTDEIRRAVKALRMRRIDLKDFESWKHFHASIKQAIEYAKAGRSSCASDTQTLRRKNAHSSTVCLFSVSVLWPSRLRACREETRTSGQQSSRCYPRWTRSKKG